MTVKKFKIVKNLRKKGLTYYGKDGKPHYHMNFVTGEMRFNYEKVDYFELMADGKGTPKDEIFKGLHDDGFLQVIEEEKQEEIFVKEEDMNTKTKSFKKKYGGEHE